MAGLAADAQIDEVLVRIRRSYTNPHVGRIEQVVLRPGPRTYRIATLLEILDSSTGEVHHFSLKIDSLDKKKDGWFHKPDKSVRLEGDEPNEIDRLSRFLQAHLTGKLSKSSDDVRIVRSGDYEKLEGLISQLPLLASPDMIELLKHILPKIRDSRTHIADFIQALEHTSPSTVRHMATAARVVDQRRAHSQLIALVESGHSNEQTFQELLTNNPWMFGSEYSELLERRKWTRDENLDFMLRRTSDNYLEVVEIKTPFGDPLLVYDKSHKSYYPSAKLSTVLGQVMRYITELERDRDSILSKDACDTLKIRARVIIGRDGELAHQEALRNLNAHLHRIEVVTYDQLVRIAARVLDIFGSEPTSDELFDEDEGAEVPF